jgi:hypothetical protein
MNREQDEASIGERASTVSGPAHSVATHMGSEPVDVEGGAAYYEHPSGLGTLRIYRDGRWTHNYRGDESSGHGWVELKRHFSPS